MRNSNIMCRQAACYLSKTSTAKLDRLVPQALLFLSVTASVGGGSRNTNLRPQCGAEA